MIRPCDETPLLPMERSHRPPAPTAEESALRSMLAAAEALDAAGRFNDARQIRRLARVLGL